VVRRDPMGDYTRTAHPSSIGLAIGSVVAALETLVVAVGYDDLCIQDRLRFLLFYGCSIAALISLSTTLLAGAAVRILPRHRSRLAVALGAAMAGFLLTGIRALWTLKTASLEPGASLALATTAASLLAGIGVGSVVYLLARIPADWKRGPVIASVALVALAAGAFLTRAGPSPRTSAVTPSGPDSGATGVLAHDQPNILLITIDTLRADHLGSYAYDRDTSPTLDAIARRGVLFEKAITQRTNTMPSLATLLTGTYPPTHRVLNNHQLLQDYNVTLAEILREHGYYTSAVISNPALTDSFNYNQGFDEYEHTETIYDIRGEELLESRLLNVLILAGLERVRGRRFFYWVHYRDPHTPYVVPEEYRQLFTGDERAAAHRRHPAPNEKAFGRFRETEGFYASSEELDFGISQYDAEIKFNDDSLAVLFEELTRVRLWDNTLVIITSDHGESLGEQGIYYEHGASVTDDNAHVPLIVVYPKFPAGHRAERPVSLVDIAPTILELLGLEARPEIQGESFAAMLVGEEQPDFRPYHFTIGDHRWGYQTHAVATSGFRLAFDADERWVLFDALVERAGALWVPEDDFNVYRYRHIRRTLYDLVNDPAEQKNVYDENRGVGERLSRVLWEWIEETYRAGRGASSIEPELSKELEDAMRELGYIR
jgi:arylsulfatase A-like enzyme